MAGPQDLLPGIYALLSSSLLEGGLDFVTYLKPTECSKSDRMSLSIQSLKDFGLHLGLSHTLSLGLLTLGKPGVMS